MTTRFVKDTEEFFNQWKSLTQQIDERGSGIVQNDMELSNDEIIAWMIDTDRLIFKLTILRGQIANHLKGENNTEVDDAMIEYGA